MSNPLPTVYGSSKQVRYPFTRVISFLTKVTTNFNGSEQRWPSRPPLTQFSLPFSALSTADRDSYLSLFNTLKGQFAQNITLTLGSTTYTDLALMSDHMDMQTKVPKFYDQQISLRQVKNASFTPGTVPTVYPTFSRGHVAMFPFTTQTSFLSNVNEQPSGPRYVFSYYGASLDGFPTGPLKGWKLPYALLTDADVTTMETFFLGVQGKYETFDFTDPTTSTLYHKCRLDTDTLVLKSDQFGHTSTELTILQTNDS